MPKTTKPAQAIEENAAEPAADATVKAPAKRKTAPRVENLVEEIVVQFAGSEWNVSDLKEKAVAAYVADGHRRGNISKFSLYLKPEEHKAYYVVNEKFDGSVDFE